MEPIAVIGMGCRFPGDSDDIDNPSALWNLLQRKGDAHSDFLSHRINVDTWYHPEQGHPGSFYTRGGCFLKQNPCLFDPSMFGISPQESRTLDPAQRKLLETVYEAFESSGTPLSRIHGSATGCFVGNFNYDHQLMQFRDADFPEPYAMTGSGIALLSNRISYVFDLQGPSLTLDTACSSSMYALHLACSAIESGECTAAIVGGSNLILTPECQIFSAALGAVSKTSRCHTFDAAADGYARAEGVGVLYIKKLDQAVKDGDPIRAIIRGTAVNANGRTGGITHPDPSGQERVIRRAYQRAGNLNPAMTSFFECHGTGTPVGDPLEVEAVGRVFAADRSPDQPLHIGSIKSNIGHCEAASGIAGIIKAVLAIEHKVMPPIRALNTVNPNVDLCSGRLHIVQESLPWPEGIVRRASINSFGYGGANAHTVLEETENLAPGHTAITARSTSLVCDCVDRNLDDGHLLESSSSPVTISPIDSFMASPDASEKLFQTAFEQSGLATQQCFLLPLSAHNEQTLRQNIRALVACTDRWNLSDLTYTLACRRSVFNSRSFVVATREQAQQLAMNAEDFAVYRAGSSSDCLLGFVFTGQGSQWPEMGKELLTTFHVYLESIRHMDRILDQLANRPDWSIEQALQTPSDTSRVHEAAISQPLVTAVQVAMVDLLRSWNILPTVSVGHSSGEIAAAYAAGYISAAEAIIVAYARGRAVARNKRKGAMLAVSTTPGAISSMLSEHPDVKIACYNSPESLTMSGGVEAIHNFKNYFDSQNTFCRILRTGDNAYHSSHMKDLGESYQVELQGMLESLSVEQLEKVQPTSTFVSSVSNSIGTEQSVDASYWRRNLESPVLFDQAVTTMLDLCPVNGLIEMGPHTSLRGPLLQIINSTQSSKSPEYFSTIQKAQDAARSVLETAGTLWAKGFPVDLGAINSAGQNDEHHSNRVIADLPKYQWQYGELSYKENRWTREWRLRTHPHHDLLGSRQPGGNQNEPMWRNILTLKHLPWLKDHMIGTDVVFPAAGYLSMAVEAAMQMTELTGIPRSQIRACTVERLAIDSALTIPDNADGVEILLNLRKRRSDDHGVIDFKYDFTITSVVRLDEKDTFVEHAHGSVSSSTNVEALHSPTINSCAERPVSPSRWYDAFGTVGLNYGPSFQCLSQINTSRSQKHADGVILTDATKSIVKGECLYAVHPTALDAAIQLAIIAAHRGRSTECDAAFIPAAITKTVISTSSTGGEPAVAWAESSSLGTRNFTSTVHMTNAVGRALVSLDGLELRRVESVALPSAKTTSHPFSRIVWRPDIKSLTTDKCQTLFSPTSNSGALNNSAPASMDILALNLLVQVHSQYPSVFSASQTDQGLSKFQAWMNAQLSLAKTGAISGGLDIVNKSTVERDLTINKLLLEVAPVHGPEARLLHHMFQNFPRIFSGEISGIEAAVKSGLLSDLYEHTQLYNAGSKRLSDIIKLISHDQAGLDIFEIGGGTGSAAREILLQLRGDSEFRGYNSYTFTDITPSFLAAAQDTFQNYSGVHYSAFDMEMPIGEQGIDKTYDVVVASNAIHVTANVRRTLINIRRLLKPGGRLALFEIVRPTLAWITLLGTFPGFWKGDCDVECPRTEGPFLTMQMWADVLPRCGFSGIDVALDHFAVNKDAAVMLSTAIENTPVISRALLPSLGSLVIVYRDTPSSFCLEFERFAQASGAQTHLMPLHAASEQSNRHVVCLAEVEQSVFLDCSEKEWTGIQAILLTSASTVWVTGGDLLGGKTPTSAMINGLVTAAHAENENSRCLAFNLDDVDETNQQQHFENILSLCTRAASYVPGGDFDYRSKAGIIYTSRLEDDAALNSVEETLPGEMDDVDIFAGNSIDGVNECISSTNEQVGEDEIEISIKESRNFTNKDSASTLTKSHDCLHFEISGIVTSSGSSVTTFKPRDHVFGLCSRLKNGRARTKALFFHHMEPGQSFGDAVSFTAASCVSLYGIQHAAKLASDESIFIYATDFSVALLACWYAIDAAASVFTVVSSEREKAMILDLASTFPSSHILVDATRSRHLATAKVIPGEGVDVVFSDAPDEMRLTHLQLLAPFGRYVQFSSSFDARSTSLTAIDNAKCVSYTSFNLDQIARLQPEMIHKLLEKVKVLRISKPLLKRLTTQEAIVVSKGTLQNGHASDGAETNPIPTSTQQFPLTDRPNPPPSNHRNISFDPTATYLLVGCLGGLGRSLSTWMISRGARNLVYLSRTGASTPETTNFITRHRANGISIQIVLGDVTSPSSVALALSAIPTRLKGIVQAPLTLKDSPLHTMTLRDFHTTLRPRVLGTLNLHHATQLLPLDFFLLLTSWTSILGSASQANYMCSSAFMDAFAHHRQSQNLPATSLSLGHMLDVGIVSDRLDYQLHLMRMGLHGNTEREFLHFCNRALSPHPPGQRQTHLLAGLSPSSLAAHSPRYPLSSLPWHRDPRFAHLLTATRRLLTSSSPSPLSSSDPQILLADDNPSLSLLTRIRARVARCLYIPVEDVDVTVPITRYGIDSMVAAQVRDWCVRTLGVEVSLFLLLSPRLTVEGLVREVERGLDKEEGAGG